MLRPQRPSRARFTTGAQKSLPALPRFINARASVPIRAPVAFQRVRLKLIAVVIGNGTLVVWCEPEPTPCVASSHQLYAGMPREGMAGVRMARAESFSARVMRWIMSDTRCSCGSVALHHGCAAKLLVGSAHGEKAPTGSFGIGGAGGAGAGAGGCASEHVTSTATYLFLLLGHGSFPPFMLPMFSGMSHEALPTQAASTAFLAVAASPAQSPALKLPQPPETTGSPMDAKTTDLISPPCEPAGPTQPRLSVGTASGMNFAQPHSVVPVALFAPAHGSAAPCASAAAEAASAAASMVPRAPTSTAPNAAAGPLARSLTYSPGWRPRNP